MSDINKTNTVNSENILLFIDSEKYKLCLDINKKGLFFTIKIAILESNAKAFVYRKTKSLSLKNSKKTILETAINTSSLAFSMNNGNNLRLSVLTNTIFEELNTSLDFILENPIKPKESNTQITAFKNIKGNISTDEKCISIDGAGFILKDTNKNNARTNSAYFCVNNSFYFLSLSNNEAILTSLKSDGTIKNSTLSMVKDVQNFNLSSSFELKNAEISLKFTKIEGLETDTNKKLPSFFNLLLKEGKEDLNTICYIK